MIFVRKQLSSAAGQHRRVGIIGTVALVQRLGAATSDALEGESAIGGWDWAVAVGCDAVGLHWVGRGTLCQVWVARAGRMLIVGGWG